jgi:hypothetical protein
VVGGAARMGAGAGSASLPVNDSARARIGYNVKSYVNRGKTGKVCIFGKHDLMLRVLSSGEMERAS